MNSRIRLTITCGIVVAFSSCLEVNANPPPDQHYAASDEAPDSAGPWIRTAGRRNALNVDQQAMVAAHNRWRAKVGVPPLVYSAELASSARDWAEQLRDANHCQMRHSGSQDHGENIFWSSAREWSDGSREIQPISSREVVDAWASERRDYDAAANRCAPGAMCGHYTQIVWRTTTAVGCGAALCPDSLEQVWVCHYAPPGNIRGRRPY